MELQLNKNNQIKLLIGVKIFDKIIDKSKCKYLEATYMVVKNRLIKHNEIIIVTKNYSYNGV